MTSLLNLAMHGDNHWSSVEEAVIVRLNQVDDVVILAVIC